MKIQIPEFIKTYGLIALIVIASFWFASKFIEPPPPSNMTIATGSDAGMYYQVAQKYKADLAEQKMTLNIIKTKGSMENIELLMKGEVDVAFVQSGLVNDVNNKHIEALASLYYEPLWIFVNVNKGVESLRDLKGKARRVNVGNSGSGTIKVATDILNANGIDKTTTSFLNLDGETAAEAVKVGQIDAAFFVSGFHSGTVQGLLRHPNVKALSLPRSRAYAKRFTYLSQVVLPEGVIDLEKNIPNEDVEMVAPVAMLVTRNDFHSALKTLILGSAMHIHDKSTVFSDTGAFPTLSYIDFPVSWEARRYFKNGPSFLQQYLPFWVADMIARLTVMLIPLIGVMIPLAKIAPPTYQWRIRSKIYRWYKDLKQIEDMAYANDDDAKALAEARDKLRIIENEVKQVSIPLSYHDELYNLRLHIQMIQEKLR